MPWPKPHPAPLHPCTAAPLRLAAKRLRVRPDACICMGVDERDIVVGRAAGMFTVAAR